MIDLEEYVMSIIITMVIMFVLLGGLYSFSIKPIYQRSLEDYNSLMDKYKKVTLQYEKLEEAFARENRSILLELHNLTERDFGPTGVYYQDRFYCVWVKDRSIEKIMKTEAHETCHHLTFKKPEHFCKNESTIVCKEH
jgi:hypothetical protein